MRTAASLLRDLALPDFREYARRRRHPGHDHRRERRACSARSCADVIAQNPENFRLFGPDETASNRLGDVFAVTERAVGRRAAADGRAPRPRGPRGRGAVRAPVPGLARGLPADRAARAVQLLRGVHPHRRLDVQPAREVAEGDARASRGGGRSPRSTTCSARTSGGRTTTASRTRIPASSTTSRTRRPRSIRVYLPPDANCLLSVADHCLRSRNYVNVIVAGKQPALALPVDGRGDRALHARASASGSGPRTTATASPDVVLACCGDVPTLETLAAAAILRERLPDLKVRVVNVVDLMRLQPDTEHPHGLSDQRVRCALHDRQADHLRLPRLSVADPPAHLPAHEPRQPARARLQGRGDDHDAVRHGHAQRPRPLPPRDRRDRPRARSRRAGRAPAPGDAWTRGFAPARTRGSTARTTPAIRDWTWAAD